MTVDYLKQRFPNERLILLGESMGAVAIMKAMSEKPLAADQLILHCPFGYMKKTTEKRFEAMGLPSFALADILLAYGGLLNGFNAFQHNPVDYAKTIQAPTLLLWGAKDARVTRAETAAIFSNLQGEKKLNTFEHSGHENYLIKHREEWRQSIKAFITQN